MEEEFQFLGLRKFIRINWLKAPKNLQLNHVKDTPLPYIKELTKPIAVGRTLEYLAGWIHSQSLASALPPHVLDPKPWDRVYDATAAPGSKTTQMAMLMENKGTIYATDKAPRLRALRANVERLGVLNTFMKVWDAKKPFPLSYNKALLDAPCSALGSHKYAWERLTPSIVRTLSLVQKDMIKAVFENLEPGGVMVYSTCTTTYEENEGVIEWLLENFQNAKLEEVKLPVPAQDAQPKQYEDVKVAKRVSARDAGEAFFIARIRKA
ncbi:MAG: RsmB/NOP family class I SAM-dependent RNA methyltransferase [Candidatus Micrarchaeota archaeon]|nr:RsmB/NOP family class I SAM-dependent RNA methyltransferase [Candidatus Micrarchaeota archaeon]